MKQLLTILIAATLFSCTKETPQAIEYTYAVQHDSLVYRGLEHYSVSINDTTVTKITHGGYWEELPVIPTVSTGDVIEVEFKYFDGNPYGDNTMSTTIEVGGVVVAQYAPVHWGEFSYIVP